MEAKTAREFFENVLLNRFKPDKAKGIDVVVQVNLSGSTQENWTVTIKDQKIEAQSGVYPSPKLTLEMKGTDFLDLVNGKMSAEKAFFTGKIKFKGDITLALRLRDAGFL
jgi:putative sterol carrier protein